MSKVDEILDSIKQLSLAEAEELRQRIEGRFQSVFPSFVEDYPPIGEGSFTSRSVELFHAGNKKIEVLKALREITPALSLKAAKDLMDSAPVVVLENVAASKAEAARRVLEAVGATVRLY